MTTLRLVTGPTNEPVSVATVKSHLRIDSTAEDALLAEYIAGARIDGEGLARRAFITQTLELTLDVWPLDPYVLPLMRPPLQNVTSVTYYDSDNVQRPWTDYVIDTDSEPGQILFNSLPTDSLRASGAITIQFVAGYGDADTDVPSSLKNALLALIAYRYENRWSNDIPRDIQQAFMNERVTWF